MLELSSAWPALERLLQIGANLLSSARTDVINQLKNLENCTNDFIEALGKHDLLRMREISAEFYEIHIGLKSRVFQIINPKRSEKLDNEALFVWRGEIGRLEEPFDGSFPGLREHDPRSIERVMSILHQFLGTLRGLRKSLE